MSGLPPDIDNDATPTGSGENPFFVETYLDSPVLVTKRTNFLINAVKVKGRLIETQGDVPRSELKRWDLPAKKAYNLLRVEPEYEGYRIVDPDEYPSFYSMTLKGVNCINQMNRSAALSAKIYKSAVTAIKSWSKSPEIVSLPETGEERFRMLSLSNHELTFYNRWRGWDTIVTMVETQQAKKKEFVLTLDLGQAGKVITNGEICLLQLILSTGMEVKRLLTWDQLLMIKDLNYSRAQVMTGLRVFYTNDEALRNSVFQLFKWHEACLTRYGNPGFEILKQSEALSKAYLSIKAGDVLGTEGPYLRMVTKIKAKELKLGADPNRPCMAERFTSLLEKIPTLQGVVEIFGLQKVSGHPLIDPIRGGVSAAGIAREADKTYLSDAARIDWNFKRMFLESWVPRNGWPALLFEDRTTKLYHLYKVNRRFIPKGSYPLSDWATCTFPRIFEFDFAPNYLEFMDDKSISQYRTNICANWDRDVQPTSHRRLLLEMISREEISAREIVYMVMKRQIPFDWLIVCTYPKEREFKIEPRMFSMLVFEMRLFFTLAESNLADQVYKYLSPQTMTLNRIEVNKIMMDMTKPIENTEFLNLFLEIDLSRWNLRWRALTIHSVGKTLDDMFGMPGIYTFVHEFFEKCLVVVRVPELRPSGIELHLPPESDLVWYHHLGGFEGLSQKHWTIATYSMIDLAMLDLAVSYKLIGQADNQILSVRAPRDYTIPLQEQLIKLRDDILERVRVECDKVNQEVKPEECLESTCVLTYSKDIYINGVYHPTSLKFHSRLFPHSSQDFPSIRTNVGAIFSTAISGGEKNNDPMRSYYLALFHASSYLLSVFSGRGIYGGWAKNTLGSLSEEKVNSLVEFFLLTPSELGGYPVTLFTSFMYKGGSDPLGKALAALSMMSRFGSSRLSDRILSQLDSSALYSTTATVSTLLQDPYSIPLRKPLTPVDGVVDLTVESLRGIVKNRAISQLLSESTSEYRDELVDALALVRPFNPLILRDVLDCSVHGIADTIKKMFVATRTIQATTRLTGIPIVTRILDLEKENLMYLFRRWSTLPGQPWCICSIHDLTIKLRSRWCDSGVPFPEGVTTYLPFDFLVVRGPTVLTTEGIHAIMITSGDVAATTRGPYDPYVGSKTREKRSEHGYKIVCSDTTSEAFRKLQLISSQTGDDPEFKKLIDIVGLSRSRTLLSDISERLTTIVGGTLSHRYASRVGYNDSFNMGSPNTATHCIISSDDSGALAGGVYDYPIMFQEMFLTCLSILACTCSGVDPYLRLMCLSTKDIVMEAIPDTVVTLPKGTSIPLMIFNDNPLAFTERIRIEKLITNTAGCTELAVSKRHDVVVVVNKNDRRMILEAWFSDSLRLNSLARHSADGGRSLFSHKQLDIAEVVSNGILTVVIAASYALADTYLLNSVRTISTSRERWVASAFLTTVAEPLTRFVSAHLGHPLLRDDATVKHYNLIDGPMYKAGIARSHQRLKAVIVSRAMVCLTNPSSRYYGRQVKSFSITSGTSDYDKTITAIARALNGSALSRQINGRTHRYLIKTYLLPILQMANDTCGKLAALDLALRTLEGYCIGKNNHLLGHEINRIYSGRTVIQHRMTSDEAVRLTRSVDVIEGMKVPRTRRSLRVNINCPTLHPVEFDIESHVKYDRVQYPIPYWPDTLNCDERYLMLTIERHRRHRTGRWTSDVTHWSLFKDFFNGKLVLSVGVGYGVVAATALSCGATHVIGLDLQDDIPMRPHRFTSYRPPLVNAIHAEDNFSFHPINLVTDGDWTNEQVASNFLASDPGTATIVIDIERGWSQHPLRLIEPLCKGTHDGAIIIRLLLSIPQLECLASDLMGSGIRFRVYVMEVWGDRVTVIIVMQVERNILKWGSPYLRVSKLNCQNTPVVAQNPDLGIITVNDLVRNVIDISECRTLQDIFGTLWVYYSSLEGTYESRIGYDQWTEVLSALTGLYWLSLEPNERIDRLKHWKNGGVCLLQIDKKQILVKYTTILESHLIRVVAGYLA